MMRGERPGLAICGLLDRYRSMLHDQEEATSTQTVQFDSGERRNALLIAIIPQSVSTAINFIHERPY